MTVQLSGGAWIKYSPVSHSTGVDQHYIKSGEMEGNAKNQDGGDKMLSISFLKSIKLNVLL